MLRIESYFCKFCLLGFGDVPTDSVILNRIHLHEWHRKWMSAMKNLVILHFI